MALRILQADADAAGLYGPHSEAWRVNREGVLLLASGPRALLLQLAHPLIAEGVNQHSDFRNDPWTRLRRTVKSYLTIVYGSTAVARGRAGWRHVDNRELRRSAHDRGPPEGWGQNGQNCSRRDERAKVTATHWWNPSGCDAVRRVCGFQNYLGIRRPLD